METILVIITILIFCGIIAVIILNYLNKCNHKWIFIKENQYNIQNSRAGHITREYIQTERIYECELCKKIKVEKY